MKNITILLFLLSTTFCFAQEARLQYVDADFRGRDCFGGMGLCSSKPASMETANAAFHKNGDGTLTLEIFREKLSPKEEGQIFGQAITAKNKDALSFQQPEVFEMDNTVKSSLELQAPSGKINTGSYPTVITEETIMIQLSGQ